MVQMGRARTGRSEHEQGPADLDPAPTAEKDLVQREPDLVQQLQDAEKRPDQDDQQCPKQRPAFGPWRDERRKPEINGTSQAGEKQLHLRFNASAWWRREVSHSGQGTSD